MVPAIYPVMGVRIPYCLRILTNYLLSDILEMPLNALKVE